MRRCRGPCFDAELGEDIAEVTANGFLADEQFGGDRLVRHTGRQESQNFEFARGQGTGIRENRRVVVPTEPPDVSQISNGTQD